MMRIITYEQIVRWLVREAQTEELLDIPEDFMELVHKYIVGFNERISNADKTSIFYEDEMKKTKKYYKQAIRTLNSIALIREVKRNESI